jgi:hypothetical protein
MTSIIYVAAEVVIFLTYWTKAIIKYTVLCCGQLRKSQTEAVITSLDEHIYEQRIKLSKKS